MLAGCNGVGVVVVCEILCVGDSCSMLLVSVEDWMYFDVCSCVRAGRPIYMGVRRSDPRTPMTLRWGTKHGPLSSARHASFCYIYEIPRGIRQGKKGKKKRHYNTICQGRAENCCASLKHDLLGVSNLLTYASNQIPLWRTRSPTS